MQTPIKAVYNNEEEIRIRLWAIKLSRSFILYYHGLRNELLNFKDIQSSMSCVLCIRPEAKT